MSNPSNIPAVTCLGFEYEEWNSGYKNVKLGDIIEEKKDIEFENLIKETEKLSIVENMTNEFRNEHFKMKELVDNLKKTNFGGTGSITNENSRMEFEDGFFTNPTENRL